MDTRRRLYGLLRALRESDPASFLRQAEEWTKALHNGSPVDQAAIARAAAGERTFRVAQEMLHIISDMRGGYDWDSLRGVPEHWYPLAVCHLRCLGATDTKYWDHYLSEEERTVLNPPFLNGPEPTINCATDQATTR